MNHVPNHSLLTKPMHLFHSLIVIIRFMLSYYHQNIMITLSGAYCNINPILNCNKDFLIIRVYQIRYYLNEIMGG